MTTKLRHEDYLEKAKLLSREEVEHLFSRMRGKLARRLDDKEMDPLEAIARQLEFEDRQLMEWRARVSEIRKKFKN
ncbi:MAG: hypothetical protein D4S02_12075 [Rhodocyclaceae bacterium]|nr:MAG: hypothetical protein D4S02_12075 [Rhodocyclaceae bacterium]